MGVHPPVDAHGCAPTIPSCHTSRRCVETAVIVMALTVQTKTPRKFHHILPQSLHDYWKCMQYRSPSSLAELIHEFDLALPRNLYKLLSVFFFFNI